MPALIATEVWREDDLGLEFLLYFNGVAVAEQSIRRRCRPVVEKCNRSLVARPAPDVPLSAFTMIPCAR